MKVSGYYYFWSTELITPLTNRAKHCDFKCLETLRNYEGIFSEQVGPIMGNVAFMKRCYQEFYILQCY